MSKWQTVFVPNFWSTDDPQKHITIPTDLPERGNAANSCSAKSGLVDILQKYLFGRRCPFKRQPSAIIYSRWHFPDGIQNKHWQCHCIRINKTSDFKKVPNHLITVGYIPSLRLVFTKCLTHWLFICLSCLQRHCLACRLESHLPRKAHAIRVRNVSWRTLWVQQSSKRINWTKPKREKRKS